MRNLTIRQGSRTLSQQILWAKNAYRRLVGLLNHQQLAENEGLLLDPCNQVHSLFMRFPIDVVFLDQDNNILRIQQLHPWRVSPIVWKAKRVLELPLGQTQAWNLNAGMRLEVSHD